MKKITTTLAIVLFLSSCVSHNQFDGYTDHPSAKVHCAKYLDKSAEAYTNQSRINFLRQEIDRRRKEMKGYGYWREGSRRNAQIEIDSLIRELNSIVIVQSGSGKGGGSATSKTTAKSTIKALKNEQSSNYKACLDSWAVGYKARNIERKSP